MAKFLPRLHFSGDFQSDPSTVNNDPRHYDTANFRSSYQLPADEDDRNGWWNPMGGAVFRFSKCHITGAVNSNGMASESDTAIGLALNDAPAAPPAKMVDIDPQQQMSTMLWGLVVSVGDSEGTGFMADFEPAPAIDIWQRTEVTPKGGNGQGRLGGVWTGLLHIRGKLVPGTSAVLQEFAGYDSLRIRFVVDGYNTVPGTPRFTFGRCSGSLTPMATPGPRQPISYRPMFEVVDETDVNTAYAQIAVNDKGEYFVNIDIGNSIPTVSVGGALRDIGILRVAYEKSESEPIVPIGPQIPYLETGWYGRSGGLFTFSISASDAAQMSTKPIKVVAIPKSANPADTSEYVEMLSEREDGIYTWGDEIIMRAEPGGEVTTKLRATRFGVPAPDVKIFFTQDSTVMEDQRADGPPVGVPLEALTVPDKVTTGPDGTVNVTISAHDPKNPRKYIDGQIYGIAFEDGEAPAVGEITRSTDILTILVFDSYKYVEQPTWVGEMQPILTQYANLYPVMRPMVDLASYSSCLSRLQALRIVFNVPLSDPNYMPVTRDMSVAKRETVQRWLLPKEPKYMDFDSYEQLCTVLQYAIELEHSTIPVYLAALYSIKPGRNVEAAAAIRAVAIEEMLHMALMANLLLSIGGTPQIGKPGFMPSYPGPLPGGVGTGLTARLRKCSIEQIRDVFMAIEQPGELAVLKNEAAVPTKPVVHTKYTIGWFYEQIKHALRMQHSKLRFGQNLDKQCDDWQFEDTALFKIHNYHDAVKAIDIITEQGEGDGAYDPTDDDGKGLSHYYRFAEIVVGKKLVFCGNDRHGRKQFSYTGADVPFDEDGVYNCIDDPVLASFKKGSRARKLTELFSDTYQTMMNNLHISFNGKPDTLKHAIGMMYTMSALARELMLTPSGRDDGTTAGVAFQKPVENFSTPRTDQFKGASTKIMSGVNRHTRYRGPAGGRGPPRGPPMGPRPGGPGGFHRGPPPGGFRGPPRGGFRGPPPGGFPGGPPPFRRR